MDMALCTLGAMSWHPVATLLLSLASIQPALAPSAVARTAPAQAAALQAAPAKSAVPEAAPAPQPAAQALPAPPAQPAAAVPAAPLNVMTFNVRHRTAQDGDNHWLKRHETIGGISGLARAAWRAPANMTPILGP